MIILFKIKKEHAGRSSSCNPACSHVEGTARSVSIKKMKLMDFSLRCFVPHENSLWYFFFFKSLLIVYWCREGTHPRSLLSLSLSLLSLLV
jgi:hypothetical protein